MKSNADKFLILIIYKNKPIRLISLGSSTMALKLLTQLRNIK